MIDRGNQDWRLMSRPAVIFDAGAPRSGQFDDDYYSPADGLAESHYVYIEGGNHRADRGTEIRRNPHHTRARYRHGLESRVSHAGVVTPCANGCTLPLRRRKIPDEPLAINEANAPWETLVDINDIIASRWPPPVPGCHRRQSMMQGFTADFWWGDAAGAKRSCELPKSMDRCVVLGRFLSRTE